MQILLKKLRTGDEMQRKTNMKADICFFRQIETFLLLKIAHPTNAQAIGISVHIE